MRAVLRTVNLTAKAALIALLLYAVLRPELPQFAGKAMEARLFTFGSSAIVLPLAWLIIRPVTYAPPIPPLAVFGCVLGFGASTHILWEFGEFLTFIRGGAEEDTAYRDTLGDLAMSLTGSVTGALLCALIAASRTRLRSV